MSSTVGDNAPTSLRPEPKALIYYGSGTCFSFEFSVFSPPRAATYSDTNQRPVWGGRRPGLSDGNRVRILGCRTSRQAAI